MSKQKPKVSQQYDNFKHLPSNSNVTEFAKIQKWGGDKNSAITFDGLKVERQEILYAEGYGIVKCIPYELHFVYEDKSKKKGRWAFMCFPPGTMIDTLNGYSPIEQIRMGDSVLSHVGRYMNVTKLYSMKYTGKMVKVSVGGNREISCTENHPLLAIRDGLAEWIMAGELKNTDHLLESIPGQGDIDFHEYQYSNGNGTFSELLAMDSDALRLFGYYLAEGYIVSGTERAKRKRYVVHFAFHKDEVEYIDDVKSLMLKYFGVQGGIFKSSENGVRLNFTSQKAYSAFDSLFGKLAWNKTIPSSFLGLPKSKLSQLLLGYWRGDGSSTSQGYSFSSSSYNLIHRIQKILFRLGIVSGISTNKADSSKFSYIGDRKIFRKHDLHNLTIYGASADSFAKIIGDASGRRKENKTKIVDNYVVYPIEDIEYSQVEDLPVYNFEVAVDNSYHANGVISHNCTCGSIAGIISYKEMTQMMTVQGTETGYVLACVAHTASKQNTGIGRHADNSSE